MESGPGAPELRVPVVKKKALMRRFIRLCVSVQTLCIAVSTAVARSTPSQTTPRHR